MTRKMGDDAGCADDEEEDSDEEEGDDVDDEANCGEAEEAYTEARVWYMAAATGAVDGIGR